MKLTHLHTREWMHTHKVDGHIGHWLHDPRFWALVVLAALIALLIILAIITTPDSGGRPMYPGYPYVL